MIIDNETNGRGTVFIDGVFTNTIENLQFFHNEKNKYFKDIIHIID